MGPFQITIDTWDDRLKWRVYLGRVKTSNQLFSLLIEVFDSGMPTWSFL